MSAKGQKSKGAAKGEDKEKAKVQEGIARYILGNFFALIRRFGNVVFVCLVIAYCSHEAASVLEAFAGKSSFADVRFGFLANIKMVYSLSLAVSGISMLLYWNERRLHRKTRERLSDRIVKLELKIDPSRTSSHLTSQGLTRKEDE